MSDFLGRLAARQVGAVAAIKPRLPGRYEPPVPAGDDAVERAVSSAGRLPVQLAAAPVPPIAPARSPSMASGEVAVGRGAPARPDHGVTPEAPARPLVAATPARAPEPDESPRIAGPATQTETPRKSTGRPIAIEAVSPAPLVAPAGTPATGDSRRPAPLPAAAFLVPRSDPAPRPFARVASPPLPAADRRPPSTPEPPVVRVSIGRIDVRPAAATERTSAPRRAAARRSPGLSLEDYLERRHGPSRGAR